MTDLDFLASVGELLLSQDNRATANPIFVVEQKVRDYCILEDYVENYCWVVDGECVVYDEQELHDEDRFGPDATLAAVRMGYRYRYEVVQPFFTEKAAQLYMDSNAHNLSEPRIFVYSGYRNREWEGIRKALISLYQSSKVEVQSE